MVQVDVLYSTLSFKRTSGLEIAWLPRLITHLSVKKPIKVSFEVFDELHSLSFIRFLLYMYSSTTPMKTWSRYWTFCHLRWSLEPLTFRRDIMYEILFRVTVVFAVVFQQYKRSVRLMELSKWGISLLCEMFVLILYTQPLSQNKIVLTSGAKSLSYSYVNIARFLVPPVFLKKTLYRAISIGCFIQETSTPPLSSPLSCSIQIEHSRS